MGGKVVMGEKEVACHVYTELTLACKVLFGGAK